MTDSQPNLSATTKSSLPAIGGETSTRPRWVVVGGALGVTLAGGALYVLGAELAGAVLAGVGVLGGIFGGWRRQGGGSTVAVANEDARLQALRRRVGKAKYLTHLGPQGDRAAAQLGECTDRFARFRATVTSKFAPTELAHDRYLGAALALRDAIYANLSAAVATLEDLDAIDPKTFSTAPERAATHERRLAEAEGRLRANDSALAALDDVMVALEALKDRGTESVEPLLEQLRDLAERASKYAAS